jgi:hypothetical protein
MGQFLEVDSQKCFGTDQAGLMGSQGMEERNAQCAMRGDTAIRNSQFVRKRQAWGSSDELRRAAAAVSDPKPPNLVPREPRD